MHNRLTFVAVFLTVLQANLVYSQIESIRDFVQINIGGLPLIHTKTNWPFDPDISLKRRQIWEETNGIKGEKLIERLGLGIDGKAVERLEQQRIRDQGHLGGLNYFRP